MNRKRISNIIFLVAIVLLVIPQTRRPIQVTLHKALAIFNSPSIIKETQRTKLKDYNWSLIDETGKSYNLKNSKGKVIIINFWATWCPPCIAEMPSLQKLYDKYGDNAEFIFVTDDSIDKIEAFKAKNSYTFPVYQTASNPPDGLTTKSIPRTVIINKKGEIVIDKSGAVDWYNSKIQEQIELLLKASI
ncbi:thiol-disulfide isomerase/thioredoxin [Winogradskyella wandonensis]|uniref:Thiol-disulfide isomerase/thioredoxin n=1 Tax=Winogradskyella wandonensis TaxID=1442586 RepID=A0A4V2PTI3_9FLAO|nr:TlpA disulfide reductase family protein [Winogradskyella wandonensis]TCK66621.1 thiol-disulfide isomerase/thioredoxin [Winogradskyella wandonensis]